MYLYSLQSRFTFELLHVKSIANLSIKVALSYLGTHYFQNWQKERDIQVISVVALINVGKLGNISQTRRGMVFVVLLQCLIAMEKSKVKTIMLVMRGERVSSINSIKRAVPTLMLYFFQYCIDDYHEEEVDDFFECHCSMKHAAWIIKVNKTCITHSLLHFGYLLRQLNHGLFLNMGELELITTNNNKLKPDSCVGMC